MGYETKLMICTGKQTGYQRIEASLEMGKVAYDTLGDLIDRKRNENKKLVKVVEGLIEQAKTAHDELFTSEGDYTDEYKDLTKNQQEKATKHYYALKHKLEKIVPYIYESNGDNEDYTDCYGDLLLVADVEVVLAAIRLDQAKCIANGDYGVMGYRRYAMAIDLLESFQKNFGSPVKVVLWGH